MVEVLMFVGSVFICSPFCCLLDSKGESYGVKGRLKSRKLSAPTKDLQLQLQIGEILRDYVTW